MIGNELKIQIVQDARIAHAHAPISFMSTNNELFGFFFFSLVEVKSHLEVNILQIL